MDNPPSVQQIFFQHVKDHLPPHLSLVDEVADLLHISIDSAYRRIRGEKAISFEEIRTLCSHFRISLDQLFHLQTDTVLFGGRFIDNEDFNFEWYLSGLLRLLNQINSFGQKEIQFMSKDIPIFHHFNFLELAAFKSFFWMKTILQYPAYNKRQFIAAEFPPSLGQICTKIIEGYNTVPSVEIWHVDCIHATLRQVEYYRDTKIFASDKDLAKVYECLHKTIDHIEAQVEQAVKFSLLERLPAKGAPLKFYINEFVVGDNTYLVRTDDSRMVLLNHSVLNTIRTSDSYFTRGTEQHFQNIIRRSTLISGVGEKERNKFFNLLHEKIEASRKG